MDNLYLLKEYLKAQSKTNEAIVENTFSADEPGRFSKSDFRRADNRGKPFRQTPVKRAKYTNLNSERIMSLLKNSEFSFISHDSVLKPNDIRTVGINRILYQQNGRIDPDSDTYRQIEFLTLQKYFPGFYHDYMQNLFTPSENSASGLFCPPLPQKSCFLYLQASHEI